MNGSNRSVDARLAREVSEVVGGPLGRFAAPRSLPAQVVAGLCMAVSGATMALGLVIQAPCIRNAWGGPDEFWHMCFSDLPTTYQTANLSRGIGAFLQGGVNAPTPEQPPLTSLVMT